MNKKKLLVTAVVLVLIIAITQIFSSSKHNNAQLEILVAPQGSTLKLDGKGIKSGKSKVMSGSHKIEAAKKGFSTQSRTIVTNQKTSEFVGIILQPNTRETADWYKNHSEDFNLVQSINNKLFDQTGSQVLKSNPLLKDLPYIGPALTYRIDYGVPTGDSKTGQPAIYIRYRTERDKQAALQWIKDQGADINSLDIIYIQGNF